MKGSCFVLVQVLLVLVLRVNSHTSSFYDLTARKADGTLLQLSPFKGQVTLVVNVASYCGWTENHYTELVELYDNLSDDDKEYFNIFAFPCNQFGEQESEAVDTIIRNMKSKYDVNFEILDKVDVVGDEADSVWNWITKESGVSPTWNFYKYIIDADGDVLGAWGPKTSPDDISTHIRQAIRQAQARANKDEL